jgi:hypothetical protein
MLWRFSGDYAGLAVLVLVFGEHTRTIHACWSNLQQQPTLINSVHNSKIHFVRVRGGQAEKESLEVLIGRIFLGLFHVRLPGCIILRQLLAASRPR